MQKATGKIRRLKKSTKAEKSYKQNKSEPFSRNDYGA